jgi:hypothetical protein
MRFQRNRAIWITRRVNVRIKSLLSSVFLLSAAIAGAQENYSNWSKYKTVKINTGSTGAATAATVANFPLLVRLDSNSADVFAQAKANGADIRFTTAAGVRLKHERERYDSASKMAEFWVRVDSVVANDTNQAIRMYWGNASAADSSKGSSVFSTTNGYLAVWHFNDAIAAKGDTLRDVTGNGHHAIADTTAGAAIPVDTAGVIGSGKNFRGAAGTTAINTGGYFSVLNADSALNLNTSTGPWTLSAWASPAVCHATARVTILSKYQNVTGNAHHGRAYALQTSNNGTYRVTNNPIDFSTETNTSAVGEFVADAPCTANTWAYLSGSYNTNGAPPTADVAGAGNLKMFKDSAASPTAQATANQQGYTIGNTSPVYIGRLTNVDRFMRGGVDELRISNVARSTDWQKLEYYNQKKGSTIVALGASLTNTPPATLHGFAYGDSAKAADTLAAFVVGTSSSVSPTIVGGPVDSFLVVSGTLPAGITLNKTTGAVGGNASAVAAASDVTIRAYGHAAMGDSVSRIIRVSSMLGPTAAFSYGRDTLKTTIGVLADTLSPSFTGRAPTGYSVSPTLPAGFALNATTGKLTGTPTGPASIGTFVLKGTNATDTVTKSLVISVVAPGPEVYTTQWSGHKDIWFNTQTNGASTTTSVMNFPVLIRLDSNAFVGATPSANGADLRFTKVNDTTRLEHQIESFNNTTKTASVWVKVDTILPNSRVQKIRMHWGNALALTKSNGPAVFDTANGFEAVWHMNDSANALDATANGFTATAMGAPTSTTGAVGTARTFNGTSQYFTVPNSVTGRLNLAVNQSYTLSAWAKPAVVTTASGSGHKIIEKGDNQYTLAIYGNGTNPRYWEITTKLNNGAATWAQATSGNLPLNANQTMLVPQAIVADSGIGKWNFIAGKYIGAEVGSAMAETVFVDAVPAGSRFENISSLTASRTLTFQVNIGAQSGTAPASNYSRYWNGDLDEVRIQSRARSADWIKLEYANQRPAGQNFVSFTQAPVVGIDGKGGNARIVAGLGLSAKASAQGVLFRLQGAAAGDKAVLTLVDMFGRTVYTSAFSSGAPLFWNGTATNGQTVSAGLYVARVTVTDARTNAQKVIEHRVPFLR